MTIKQSFKANDLTVSRGEVLVFENLNLSLRSGNLLKLIGPNGSGKSTLLKSLAGLLRPSGGEIIHNDRSVMGDYDWAARSFCYLGHKNALKNEFTVEENIIFWAKICGTEKKVGEAISKMGVDYLRDTPVAYLSSGQTRRVALARILCHPAEIWLLDEPTVGLDDQGLEYLRDAMGDHMTKGGIIICATHVDLGIDESLINILDIAEFSPRNKNGQLER